MNYTGERAIPWKSIVGADVMIPHLQRYAFAAKYCWQRDVVDLACGTGYGSYLLSMVSKSVHGVDIDTEAISFAFSTFKAPNLRYGLDDITLGFPVGEVYTAFECLEHLNEPLRVFDLAHGTLIYSIPVEDGSRFHKRAYTVADIELMFGGLMFWQDSDGTIVPKQMAWFPPKYIIGVRPCEF